MHLPAASTPVLVLQRTSAEAEEEDGGDFAISFYYVRPQRRTNIAALAVYRLPYTVGNSSVDLEAARSLSVTKALA